jgi:signal transduction histidine kinase
MIRLYYYLTLLSGAISFAVAITAFWKNRFQKMGLVFGLAMLLTAAWLIAFAQYFRPMPEQEALLWAQLTLSAGVLIPPFYFHSGCEAVDKAQRFRWSIALSYLVGVAFVTALWLGYGIDGLRAVPYMDHYVKYNRSWYPLLVLQITGWQGLGFGVLVSNARRASGYKRTQLVYFIVAWLMGFLSLNGIILPIEYGFNTPPLAFFILPVSLALFPYAMIKVRLADFNVVAARLLLYTLMLLVMAAASLLFIAAVTAVAPGFINPQQTLFAVALVVVIGMGLTAMLPRFLPRAERIMQERMFGKRYGYQDVLSGLMKELSTLSTVDQLLSTVATTVHSQMQVSRVLILMQDLLLGDYKLRAESGLGLQDDVDALVLKVDSAIVEWLEGGKDALVRDEMLRRTAPLLRQHLETELDQLKVNVCMPMILDSHLVGLICLGEKLNHDMFFGGDLRVLETLATEVALAVKYRRMEDQILRKNKLIELGTIAAGVAHEIRNPLASIRTFAQLMPDRMDDPEFKNEFSKLVMQDVDRITKVVESMLAFARPAQITIAEYTASELVEEAVLLAQSRLKFKRIELTKQFHEQPVLRVDKQQILQVLVNLLSNAADALPEQGKIRVATGIRTLEDARRGNGSQRYGVIEVADNGPGIPAAVRNRLFDPFFTTKKEGTGLGLSISQKIARDHGGIITVSSIEGKGTTFQVNLPLN